MFIKILLNSSKFQLLIIISTTVKDHEICINKNSVVIKLVNENISFENKLKVLCSIKNTMYKNNKI